MIYTKQRTCILHEKREKIFHFEPYMNHYNHDDTSDTTRVCYCFCVINTFPGKLNIWCLLRGKVATKIDRMSIIAITTSVFPCRKNERKTNNSSTISFWNFSNTKASPCRLIKRHDISCARVSPEPDYCVFHWIAKHVFGSLCLGNFYRLRRSYFFGHYEDPSQGDSEEWDGIDLHWNVG